MQTCLYKYLSGECEIDYSFSNSFVCLFVCFQNESDDCFWKIHLSFTSVCDKKMTDFVELLTIVLLFCPQSLEKTVNICFACICFYKFIQSITGQILFSKTQLFRGRVGIYNTRCHGFLNMMRTHWEIFQNFHNGRRER